LKYGQIADFILNVTPTFCWCTRRDLFLMMEQLYEDVDESVFIVRFSKMVRAEHFFVKKADFKQGSRGPAPFLYLRKK
jgi:hypothetical protein